MHATKEHIRNLGRLQKRRDFLRVGQSGRKWVSDSAILQVADSNESDMFIGYTVSKRVSKNAVVRNRVKRRLKAAVCDVFPGAAKDASYVIIGRPGTLHQSYDKIKKDLYWCLKRLDCLEDAS